jgi:pimeloyl-ACP methyl ester carboxylesterase
LRPLIAYLLPRRVIRASLHNVYGDPNRVDEALVDRYYELALRDGNRRALGLRFAHVMPTHERAGRIATITQPTLILWGGRDRLIPLESGHRFARDIAGSRLVVFDALGHVPHEESPLESVAVVKDFLSGLD